MKDTKRVSIGMKESFTCYSTGNIGRNRRLL